MKYKEGWWRTATFTSFFVLSYIIIHFHLLLHTVIPNASVFVFCAEFEDRGQWVIEEVGEPGWLALMICVWRLNVLHNVNRIVCMDSLTSRLLNLLWKLQKEAWKEEFKLRTATELDSRMIKEVCILVFTYFMSPISYSLLHFVFIFQSWNIPYFLFQYGHKIACIARIIIFLLLIFF